MNKPKLKAIRFGTNDVITTSGFNGFHLYNLGDKDVNNNKLFKVENGKETGENLFSTYATMSYDFNGTNATNFPYLDPNEFASLNGYYTLSGNSFKFEGTDMPTKQ